MINTITSSDGKEKIWERIMIILHKVVSFTFRSKGEVARILWDRVGL